MWRGSEDAGLRGVWRTANALTVTSRRSNDILACPDRSMPALATGYRVRLALDRPIPDVRRRAQGLNASITDDFPMEAGSWRIAARGRLAGWRREARP